ncbi:hypothetical protein TSOC_011155 [Tetrabaena socialis]|uniref:Uncharacterized protein n=1 Tax=Tetrabaena socialis TaxID=47790 RepID=A0A2J7ZRG6_9CHLO|nr:hypothetical protein TSOC_011155 [Tetrabaena socialis]|eukprot:PNH02830.1 hypothetical protein TSOC_011155 [Tetrabaena socialis]
MSAAGGGAAGGGAAGWRLGWRSGRCSRGLLVWSAGGLTRGGSSGAAGGGCHGGSSRRRVRQQQLAEPMVDRQPAPPKLPCGQHALLQPPRSKPARPLQRHRGTASCLRAAGRAALARGLPRLRGRRSSYVLPGRRLRGLLGGCCLLRLLCCCSLQLLYLRAAFNTEAADLTAAPTHRASLLFLLLQAPTEALPLPQAQAQARAGRAARGRGRERARRPAAAAPAAGWARACCCCSLCARSPSSLASMSATPRIRARCRNCPFPRRLISLKPTASATAIRRGFAEAPRNRRLSCGRVDRGCRRAPIPRAASGPRLRQGSASHRLISQHRHQAGCLHQHPQPPPPLAQAGAALRTSCGKAAATQQQPSASRKHTSSALRESLTRLRSSGSRPTIAPSSGPPPTSRAPAAAAVPGCPPRERAQRTSTGTQHSNESVQEQTASTAGPVAPGGAGAASRTRADMSGSHSHTAYDTIPGSCRSAWPSTECIQASRLAPSRQPAAFSPHKGPPVPSAMRSAAAWRGSPYAMRGARMSQGVEAGTDLTTQDVKVATGGPAGGATSWAGVTHAADAPPPAHPRRRAHTSAMTAEDVTLRRQPQAQHQMPSAAARQQGTEGVGHWQVVRAFGTDAPDAPAFASTALLVLLQSDAASTSTTVSAAAPSIVTPQCPSETSLTSGDRMASTAAASWRA